MQGWWKQTSKNTFMPKFKCGSYFRNTFLTRWHTDCFNQMQRRYQRCELNNSFSLTHKFWLFVLTLLKHCALIEDTNLRFRRLFNYFALFPTLCTHYHNLFALLFNSTIYCICAFRASFCCLFDVLCALQCLSFMLIFNLLNLSALRDRSPLHSCRCWQVFERAVYLHTVLWSLR